MLLGGMTGASVLLNAVNVATRVIITSNAAGDGASREGTGVFTALAQRAAAWRCDDRQKPRRGRPYGC